jgi:hypothetical protein
MAVVKVMVLALEICRSPSSCDDEPIPCAVNDQSTTSAIEHTNDCRAPTRRGTERKWNVDFLLRMGAHGSTSGTFWGIIRVFGCFVVCLRLYGSSCRANAYMDRVFLPSSVPVRPHLFIMLVASRRIRLSWRPQRGRQKHLPT